MTRLDIFSDPVCPWCLIGKANLDRALRDAGGAPFQITWHPFQLNPDMPQGGLPLHAYLTAKFGSEDRARAMYARVEGFMAELGIDVDVEAVPKALNTADAHRVIHWAGVEGVQDAVVDGLFRAYWTEGRDIADHATLADIAAGAGMDRAAVLRLLATDADRDMLAAREAHARARGITAVPTFIIADRHVVSGAQPPDLWARVIAEVTA
jgi:predicted DsbA family dithiol-disulfide isomerase